MSQTITMPATTATTPPARSVCSGVCAAAAKQLQAQLGRSRPQQTLEHQYQSNRNEQITHRFCWPPPFGFEKYLKNSPSGVSSMRVSDDLMPAS